MKLFFMVLVLVNDNNPGVWLCKSVSCCFSDRDEAHYLWRTHDKNDLRCADITHTHTHTHTHTQSVVDWTSVWWLEASVSSSCHSVVSYWYIYQLNTSFTHKVHSKHHLLYTYWILLLCFSFVGTCDRNRYFYLLFISLILCLTLLFVF